MSAVEHFLGFDLDNDEHIGWLLSEWQKRGCQFDDEEAWLKQLTSSERRVLVKKWTEHFGPKETKKLQVKLTIEQYRQLERLAKSEFLSLNTMVVKLINTRVAEAEHETGIESKLSTLDAKLDELLSYVDILTQPE